MAKKASRPARQGQRTAAQRPATLTERFSKFAQRTAVWTGHPAAFLFAVAMIVVWIVTGPMFHYSDTWQLVINTGTTIVTFLMVFLIQNTQNRDTMAIQLKLSELVIAMKGAKNEFAAIEDMSDDQLKKLHDEFRTHADMALDRLESRHGKSSGGTKPRAAAHRARSQTRRSARRKS